ncbi:cell wall-binding repeat-containing protein [Planococcus citreus]|uniref:Putative cell wall-binding protein n=1 Tax=Planococcus citreus TaxID=1373 RepID=A0A497YJ94_9BACL|nr:cell wall-binding repeat-containing protein [Planococcus citreus]RLJ90659.1 putative cell wall-binding protein [Planococcus citreus]
MTKRKNLTVISLSIMLVTGFTYSAVASNGKDTESEEGSNQSEYFSNNFTTLGDVTEKNSYDSSKDVQTILQQESVSIKTFGAKGDGVSDDTNAIRDAFNSDVGDLYFPTGVYKVTAPIVVNSGKARKITGEPQVVISAHLAANQNLFSLKRNLSFKNIEFDFNSGPLQYGIFYSENLGEISLENLKFKNIKDINSSGGTIVVYFSANGNHLNAENLKFENMYKKGNGIIGDAAGNLTSLYVRNGIEDSAVSAHLKGIKILNTHNIDENNKIIFEDVSGIYIVDKGKPENNKIIIEDIHGHNFGKRLIKLQASNVDIRKVVAFSDTNDSFTAISVLADPLSIEMNKNNTITDVKVQGKFNVALASNSKNTTFRNININVKKPNLVGNQPVAYGVRIAGGSTLVENGTIEAEIPLENLSGYGGKLQVKDVTVIPTGGGTETDAESTNRISGSNRYLTAIAISREGWDSSEVVVLATGADFPDALAGGPLAFKEDAPILLTKTSALTPETKQEIQRLGAKKVIVLGRTSAVSAEVESDLKRMNLNVERIGGQTRFDTAALIAGKLNSDKAIVANGLNFPDVLSVSSYAAKNGVPILLTRPDRLPEETKVVLKNTTSTYVIGSTIAVSNSVFKTLTKPTRLGGKDRYETGHIVATTLTLGTDKAYIATAMNFPDALAGSVLAAKNNAPILLVRSAGIPDATYRQLDTYDGFSIFGDTGAVSDSVKVSLDEALKK